MIFPFLFLLSLSTKKICVCKNECPQNCPEKSLSAHFHENFDNFLKTASKNENEVEIYLYSDQKKFIFQIDPEVHSETKVTLITLSNSQPITVKYTNKDQLRKPIIELFPNYQMDVPNLTPYESKLNMHIKQIKESTPTPIPTPESIPIPIGIHQMQQGNLNCESSSCQITQGGPLTFNSGTLTYSFKGGY